MEVDIHRSKQAEAERVFESKRAYHLRQAKLPIKEKVRILLAMQMAAYPILSKRRKLEWWEKPWEVEP